MIDVDISSYLQYTHQQPRSQLKYGVRLMQWASYVRHCIPELSVSDELELLDRDTQAMGSATWWT